MRQEAIQFKQEHWRGASVPIWEACATFEPSVRCQGEQYPETGGFLRSEGRALVDVAQLRVLAAARHDAVCAKLNLKLAPRLTQPCRSPCTTIVQPSQGHRRCRSLTLPLQHLLCACRAPAISRPGRLLYGCATMASSRSCRSPMINCHGPLGLVPRFRSTPAIFGSCLPRQPPSA